VALGGDRLADIAVLREQLELAGPVGLVRDRRPGLGAAGLDPSCSPWPGPPRRWEPKRLRLRLFSAAGQLARGGRRLRLRLAERWPWASQVTAAVTILQAIPSS
jgi:hypothetical protein